MEAETRALHKEWSEQQAEDAGASGRASAAEGQAEKEASPPTTGLDASLEQRVRSLDLEASATRSATSAPAPRFPPRGFAPRPAPDAYPLAPAVT